LIELWKRGIRKGFGGRRTTHEKGARKAKTRPPQEATAQVGKTYFLTLRDIISGLSGQHGIAGVDGGGGDVSTACKKGTKKAATRIKDRN